MSASGFLSVVSAGSVLLPSASAMSGLLRLLSPLSESSQSGLLTAGGGGGLSFDIFLYCASDKACFLGLLSVCVADLLSLDAGFGFSGLILLSVCFCRLFRF